MNNPDTGSHPGDEYNQSYGNDDIIMSEVMGIDDENLAKIRKFRIFRFNKSHFTDFVNSLIRNMGNDKVVRLPQKYNDDIYGELTELVFRAQDENWKYVNLTDGQLIRVVRHIHEKGEDKKFGPFLYSVFSQFQTSLWELEVAKFKRFHDERKSGYVDALLEQAESFVSTMFVANKIITIIEDYTEIMGDNKVVFTSFSNWERATEGTANIEEFFMSIDEAIDMVLNLLENQRNLFLAFLDNLRKVIKDVEFNEDEEGKIKKILELGSIVTEISFHTDYLRRY